MNTGKNATPSVPRRPTRADARRNYESLVTTADVAFAEQGPDVSLDEIVRRAGVGSGTLYRHFPNREALMTAVFWGRVEALCEHGRALLTESSGGDALITWLRMLIDFTSQHRLGEALLKGQQPEASELFEACHNALHTTVEPLLAQAQAEGAIRPELTGLELLMFAHAIASSVRRFPDRAVQAARMLDVLLGGLLTRRECHP